MQIFSKLLFFSFNYPKSNILLFLILSLASFILFINNIKIVTSTDDLISQKLDFRVKQKELKDKFPNLANNNVISIKTSKASDLNKQTNKILSELKQRKSIFNFYYSPQIDESFKKNILKIVDNSTREKIIYKLYNFQPFISILNNNPKFKGLNNILELSLSNQNLDQNSQQFEKIFKNFLQSIKNNEELIWNDVFFDNDENLIIFSLKNEFLDDNKFSDFYNFLISLKEKYSPEVNITFTGGQILDHEEIQSVTTGAYKAATISLLLISLVLSFAFRNIKIIASLVLSILVGLAITLGITSITVGKLNMISIAFAVLFIGISVDIGIQISMKLVQSNLIKERAEEKLQDFSFSILVVGISSIIGFLSFIPTKYIGLSELGIISSIGVVVGIFTNLFFLSSLLKVSKIENITYTNTFINQFFEKIIIRVKKSFYFFVSLLVFAFIFIIINLEKIKFDSDPLKLKDQDSLSVKLAYELMSDDPSSDYKISIISKKFNNDTLSELTKSKYINSIFRLDNSFLSEKYGDDLDHLSFLLSFPYNHNKSEASELNRFKENIRKINELDIKNLSSVSKSLLDLLNSKKYSQYDISFYEDLLFGDFINFKSFLSEIINLENLSKSDLPSFYKEKYFSGDGYERIEIYPEPFVIDENKVEEFVETVKKKFPQATGMPVVQNAAKNIVIESFVFAFSLSFILLALLTFVIFRNIIYVFLCFIPLLLSLFFTILIMLVCNINLNFANMISLPLLFSLGISYSIFMVRKFYESKSFSSLLESSIIPGILFSALTTICSFSTLALSSHYGTSSMGILLFVSLSAVMINSLIFLPVFILIFRSKL